MNRRGAIRWRNQTGGDKRTGDPSQLRCTGREFLQGRLKAAFILIHWRKASSQLPDLRSRISQMAGNFSNPAGLALGRFFEIPFQHHALESHHPYVLPNSTFNTATTSL